MVRADGFILADCLNARAKARESDSASSHPKSVFFDFFVCGLPFRQNASTQIGPERFFI